MITHASVGIGEIVEDLLLSDRVAQNVLTRCLGAVADVKGKATESPRVSKFLEKFCWLASAAAASQGMRLLVCGCVLTPRMDAPMMPRSCCFFILAAPTPVCRNDCSENQVTSH